MPDHAIPGARRVVSGMIGKRQLAARLFTASGMARLLLHWRRSSRQTLTVLAYHRVYDIRDEASFPFDPELISASAEMFAWQMDFVRRYFSPIRFSDVLEALGRGAPLPPRSLIVSFDDGHLDNYTNAFPILKSLGVPATIFLSTGYIGAPQTFWFDRVAALIYHAPEGELDIPALSLKLSLGQTVATRRTAAETILSRLKRLPNTQRLDVLDRLEAQLSRHVPVHAADASAALTWAQVEEMSRAGIEFGSHTVTHPVLTMLDDARLHDELADSKRVIELKTGRPAPVLAYPVGGDYAFDQRVITQAKDCGYRLGVSYLSGVNRWNTLDPFSIKRLHVERYTARSDFEAMLALPLVFG